MRKTAWAMAWMISLAWVLPIGGNSGNAWAETRTVVITDFTFEPVKLTIRAGDTVEFVNEDGPPHTATREGKGRFDTETLNQGQKKKITFKNPGEYKYGCSIHPSMQATIIVK